MNFSEFKKKYQKLPVKEYPNQVPDNVTVSVCVQTYNHVEYIKECLDGILMQKTDFAYEILLGEDASTDGTREICLEYAEKFPSKIRLFLHHRENNISLDGSPSGRFNMLYNFYSSKGKYIAMCEGDDYWTDPLKLQKQVDFLEDNADYSLCFHNTSKLVEPSKTISQVTLNISEPITMNKLIKRNFIHTASVVYRNSIIDINYRIFSESPMGDYPLFILLLEKGKIKFLDDFMSVYRIHKGGEWSHISQENNINKKIKFYSLLLNYFDNEEKYKNLIENKIRELSINKLSLNNSNANTVELKIAHEGLDLVSSKRLIKEFNKRILNKLKW